MEYTPEFSEEWELKPVEQIAPLQRGFDLPKYGCDADFGEETRSALVRFQKAYNSAFGTKVVEEDGVCGKMTWQALTAEVI